MVPTTFSASCETVSFPITIRGRHMSSSESTIARACVLTACCIGFVGQVDDSTRDVVPEFAERIRQWRDRYL
jgi:hypothetical protein